jgi:hypothetical protein
LLRRPAPDEVGLVIRPLSMVRALVVRAEQQPEPEPARAPVAE